MRSRVRGGGGAGQQELARRRPGIHRTPHLVPDGREVLPLVDQDGGRRAQQPVGVGFCNGSLARIIELVDGFGALRGSRGLADGLRSFNGDGGRRLEQLIQLVIKDAALIARESIHAERLPFRPDLHYRFGKL
jgi:hypothetical protein